MKNTSVITNYNNMMTCQIGELRATIFTGPIVYDSNNLNRVAELLPEEDGFVPNQVTSLQLIPGLNIPVPISNKDMPTEWEMFSEKTQYRIHFGPQKIDIVKNSFKLKEQIGFEKEFCDWASGFFERIIARFSLTPTRLAFAPTYIPEWTKEFSKHGFNESIYKKTEFKGSSQEGLLFKQVYRVDEVLGVRNVKFNYVAEASEGQNIIENVQKKSITIKQMLNLSLDINTFQKNDIVFDIDELKEFFNNAPTYAESFLEYYIG